MKQQPLLGFLFALTTAIAWGTLPIALKQVMTVMNSQTIVWYRFLVAALFLGIFLFFSKNLPSIRQFNRRLTLMSILGVIGLAGNFWLFNTSLGYLDASVAQIFVLLSSFIMMLCGVIFFKESLGLHQKIGLILLLVGLVLFFNDHFSLLISINLYSIGILISTAAASIWVLYGLTQKILLRSFSSSQILFLMYLGCAILFAPFANFSKIQDISGFTIICFIYCCLNTVIGYGCYAEALNRWDVAKVSAMITLTPLFTMLFSILLHFISPQHFNLPELNLVSYIGAIIVISGAMLSAIGQKLIK